MMLRGMAVATVLISVAILNIEYSNGAGAQPTPTVEYPQTAKPMTPPQTDMRLGTAPFSLGNPSTATALDDLQDTRVAALSTIVPELAEVQPEPVVPSVYKTAIKIKSGDTLSKALRRSGAKPGDAEAAIRALKGHYDPRKLKAGQTIYVNYAPTTGTPKDPKHTDQFAGFEVPLDYANRVAVAPAPEGGFKAHLFERDLKTEQVRAEGVIDWSLFKAGSDAGVPAITMAELVRAFSWDVDFQRDIRKNDRFEVMYERKLDEAGEVVHNGKILYAALELSGDRKPIYLHTLKDGRTDYFDDNGQSAKKALMRTPIDGARLSSHFGKRRHPILGYTKKHSGTDFAAPPGTPIYAAGDGVIELAGWKGGYGKYVRIRHNSEYSTAYAHMKAIKRGMGKGKRVKQGQVIGYVGTTGRSTGPHLHYEIMRRGTKVNPMRVKMPSGQKLKGDELKRFVASRDELKVQWASLTVSGPQLAQR
ncbi:MAG: peptidoglycan DD-metalloendopeptidase family protein [Magnetovibrio sp.]|nr:peptidoglycan DD-metalloendopeptidase family protein [Magnetovibrio sp.]